MLDRYPVASIRDIRISPGLFSVGPWGKKLIAIEGESLSLDDIKHRILRPVWRDPHLRSPSIAPRSAAPTSRARRIPAPISER